MKQISSWIAIMRVLFWGMLGIAILARSLAPEVTRLLTNLVLPPLTIISGMLGLFWFLRRRARIQRAPDTLDDIRRRSRQRMAGEPIDEHCLVRPPRVRHDGQDCDDGKAKDRIPSGIASTPPGGKAPSSDILDCD
jgi:hypothetical protein